MGSVSKKVRMEPPPNSSCSSQDVENELPSEDDSKFLEDLEDKMKGQNPKGVVNYFINCTVPLVKFWVGNTVWFLKLLYQHFCSIQ